MSRVKALVIIVHVAAWVMFMAFPLVFLNSQGKLSDSVYFFRYPEYWLFGLIFMVLYYSNTYLLVPRFLLNKRYFLYAGAVLILFAFTYFIKPFDRLLHIENMITGTHEGAEHPMFLPPGPGSFAPDRQPREERGPPPGGLPHGRPGAPPGRERFNLLQPVDFTSYFLFLMVMGGSAFLTVMQQWRSTEQRAARAEADKAHAELSFLKAQINPHFLFNTLNNIYTLVLIKDDHAADSVMKLSNIMRYVTDDVTRNYVPLQREIDCMTDYIELQRLRTGTHTIIDFTVTGDTNGRQVAPMILMTFVENIFKYGISKHERSVIQIKVSVDNMSLSFYSRNRIFGPGNSEYQQTGIGLKNTRQRLEQLYPGKHLLNISAESDYIVQLTLQT